MAISKNIMPGMGRAAWFLLAVIFGYLWFILIHRLQVAWTLYPQYSYGWAVPFLCAYLIWRRITDPGLRTTDHRPPYPVKSAFYTSLGRPRPSSLFYLLLALLAFLYALVRLVQAANSVWTLDSWGLALVVIGLTLCLLRLPPATSGSRGRDPLRPGRARPPQQTHRSRSR